MKKIHDRVHKKRFEVVTKCLSLGCRWDKQTDLLLDNDGNEVVKGEFYPSCFYKWEFI